MKWGPHLVGLWHAWSHPNKNKTSKQTPMLKYLDLKFEPKPNPKTKFE
jgi:hypothetical protein